MASYTEQPKRALAFLKQRREAGLPFPDPFHPETSGPTIYTLGDSSPASRRLSGGMPPAAAPSTSEPVLPTGGTGAKELAPAPPPAPASPPAAALRSPARDDTFSSPLPSLPRSVANGKGSTPHHRRSVSSPAVFRVHPECAVRPHDPAQLPPGRRVIHVLAQVDTN